MGSEMASWWLGVGILDDVVPCLIGLKNAGDKIEKNKIHQNRWFFIFLVWLGIGNKGNAVGFGQNGSLIR